MKQIVDRFFLELKKESSVKNFSSPLLNSGLKIVKEKKGDFEKNKFFYKQIGADHFWRDRLVWTDRDWSKYVSNPNLETWIMKKKGDLIGFYELEFHKNKNEIELINLGILKEFRSQKYGSLILKHMIKESFKRKINRVWVHTCSLDHKFALNNYLSKGFKIFKEEKINFVA